MKRSFLYIPAFFIFSFGFSQTLPFSYKNDYDNKLLNTEEIKTDYSRTWMDNGDMNFVLDNENLPFFSTEFAPIDEDKQFILESEIMAEFKTGKAGKFGLTWGYKAANTTNVFVINEKNQFKIYQVKAGEYISVIDWTSSGLKPEEFSGKIKFKIKQAEGITEFFLNGIKKHSCKKLNLFGSRIGYNVGTNMEASYLYLKQDLGKITTAASSKDFLAKEVLKLNLDKSSNEINPMVAKDGKTIYFTQAIMNRAKVAEERRSLCKASLDKDGNAGDFFSYQTNFNGIHHDQLVSVPENGEYVFANVQITKNDHAQQRSVYCFKYTGTEFAWPKRILKQTPGESEIVSGLIDEKSVWQNLYFNNGCFSQGKKVFIYACDNRDDAVLQMDLYAVFKTGDSTYSKPVKLGPVINSFGDDECPFLMPDDKTLYFSSNGHPGYGSSDVFVSRRLDDTWTNWSKPENLGPVVNGPAADLYFHIPEKGGYAFMSSTNGFWNNLDLFKLKMNLKKEWVLSGIVINKKTDLPQPGAKIKALDNLTKKIVDSTTVGKTGEYEFKKLKPGEYTVIAESGILSNTITVVVKEEERELHYNVNLNPIEAGQSLVLHNISFEPNKFEILSSSFPELDKLAKFMQDNKDIRIEIHGHTSMNNEGVKFNIDLSTHRASAVKDYLVAEGIKEGRITYKGFGFNEPIYKGDNIDEQSKNRRVEIIFLK
ncbi:MAG: OmpA family protein [Bacteroidia bacterium]|nr:OmpA family protein [Bacteroidia bacterium]